MFFEPFMTFGSNITAQSMIMIFPRIELQLRNYEILINLLKTAKTPKMGLISISNHKKVTWTKFERNPLEKKSFKIFISETLICSAPLAKLLSRLPESPIQLTYFTIIIFLVSKLSFSVKKLKKYQMGKKLWLLEVTVKFFLELVLFK